MKKKLTYLPIIAVVSMLFIYASNNLLQVSYYNLDFIDMPESFEGYKIVHLSDLHNHAFGKNQKNLIRKIDVIDPDIIVISGDFIDSRKYNLASSMDLIYGLADKYKIYYATGNNEAWSVKFNEVEEALLKAGVIVLRNNKKTIYLDNDEIDIIGIEDPSFGIKLPELEIDRFSIMISHRSELIEYYEESNVDVVFSGHAHGGQFRLFNNGIYSPGQGYFPEYTQGVHELGNTKLVISRGLGNSVIPFRVFNRPEIVVVELNRKVN